MASASGPGGQGDPPRRPLHQQATLTVASEGRGIGYELDGVAYGLIWPGPEPVGLEDSARMALLHAAALELLEVEVALPPAMPLAMPAGMRVTRASEGDPARALEAARLALAVCRMAEGHPLTGPELRAVRQQHGPPVTPEVILHADGSADKLGGSLSVGYTLNGRPYETFFLHERGHENLAEREAIRLALTHARFLGYTRFRVRSDHKFHVRRYAEGLIHRGRRKSASLERLDALVDELGDAVHFEYAVTNATDAPHRLAVHARALHRLASGQPLSHAQRVALRRVHFARKAGGGVPY
ncbi:hypothetical protein E5F05_20215 [Deinococcus metallilatus]|uniref:Ribonuclease HI n=1 Tax=Deinococcus metallilatus TaxID=1211322 RepID=A0AAJ5F1Z0_9DEIO|nr:hypothetical protein [Deinococcus metallilatus]MBB5297152.1 ribonuclease HI [Deinococcus metallilatus]QBY10063.1 hypothetical protein E5F05_20215 [Deinococcus metallilatus]RXJ08318.1 hypothetical protein ERJ73_19055 [Deinococcus metallilatus]TLK21972.1 hypothetical protein FCS05_18430 [Deinococcus metallilatus]GMA17283.1 hypothetical protein GCM10025871_36140 [Deinococcus metallilatus]